MIRRQNSKHNEDVGPNERKNIVPMLHAFAKDFLKVKYMFWVNQEPYFTEDLIPCFNLNNSGK